MSKPLPLLVDKRRANPKDRLKLWKKWEIDPAPEGRGLVRMLVRIRDDFRCQGHNCRRRRTPRDAKRLGKRMFDVHHLDGMCGQKSRGYDKLGDAHQLITLCHECHYRHHEFRKTKHNTVKGREDEVLLLRSQGLTYDEIGKKMGVSQCAVWRLAKKTLDKDKETMLSPTSVSIG